jgi:Sulfotransferase family
MSDAKAPIFIGGLSYSGKTQLRMVLGAHPEISMTRRTSMWDRFHGRFGDLGDPRNLDRCLSTMVADEGVRQLEPDPERIRWEFLHGPTTYARLFGLFHRHHADRRGKRRWGDQLGFVERFADLIFAAFPSARLIHMVRDPRTRYRAGMNRGGRRPGAVGWETAKWLRSADLAERNRRRYPGRYVVVRYEDLAARPVQTVRQVCAFLGEEFLPSMERAIGTIAFDIGDRALGGDGTGTLAEIAFVDRYAGPRLRSFDYGPLPARLAPRRDLSFILLDWPLNRATMAAWSLLEKGPSTKRVAR